MHATNTFPVDRHPQYRHYPTTIRSIASGIIIEVKENHITYIHCFCAELALCLVLHGASKILPSPSWYK
jgi:hypothetical protein